MDSRELVKQLGITVHSKSEERVEYQDYLDMDLLKDYIAYAKTFIKPMFTEPAGRSLIEAYLEMRKIVSGKGQITAYSRLLHSLIRLSEAHTKLRFSDKVDIVDVEEAMRLHREALKQSAIDPKTGRIDASILTTGYSNEERRQREQIAHVINRLIKDKGKITTIKIKV
jgi:DNA replication licensing factor MCM4